MSKKIQVTVPDDIYLWLSKESDLRGTKVATLVTILLGESRKAQRNQDSFNALIDKMKTLTPEQFATMVSPRLPKDDEIL